MYNYIIIYIPIYTAIAWLSVSAYLSISRPHVATVFSVCTYLFLPQDSNGNSKLSDISERVRSVMTNCPKCNITYTAGPFFSCLGTDSDQTVVFRAQIVYQYIRNSPINPLSLLQSWVSSRSGPLLTVLQQQLRVNSVCQVERSLNIVPQCTPDLSRSPSFSPPSSTSLLYQTSSTSLPSPTSFASPPPPMSSSSTAIIVSVCVLFVLLVFLVAMVIVLILCIRRWKRNRFVVCTILHITFHVNTLNILYTLNILR